MSHIRAGVSNWCWIFLALLAFASCTPPAEPSQVLASGWSVASGTTGYTLLSDRSTPGAWLYPEQGWTELTVEFSLTPEVAQLHETWIVLGKLDFPLEARVNGVMLYRRGVLPPGEPFVQSSNPAVFLVPSLVWSPGGVNILTVRAWKVGDRVSFPEAVFVGGPLQADFQLGPVAFLNSTLFLMFFGINLLAGVYFLMLWAGRPKQRDQLWFALSTLLIGLYFLSLGSPLAVFPGVLHFTLLKACLLPSIGFLILFLIEHFDLLNRTWIKAVLVALFTVAGIYVGLSNSMNELAARFTLAMLPLEVGILFTIVLMVTALIKRRPQAPLIAAGIVIGVAFGSHDVYFQVTGQIPVAWLQGVGFFALEASMFFSLALHSTRIYNEVERQKDTLARTNTAFSRFVPQELLSFLGKDSVMDVNLGDQVQKNMTILFSDIRNFTFMTESLSPRESFNLLNSYLARMGPIIRAHNGIVDKYIGDAIMALFPGSPLDAVEAALDMRRSLEDYNKGRVRAGYEPLEMGVGLHTGPLMLGTIGEDQRMDGTVISDAVNTSSRIEGLTKLYRIPVMVSQATLAADPRIPETVPHRYLGLMNVKGKTVGLALYEILDKQDPATAGKLAHKDLFEAAVRSREEDDEAASAVLFQAYRDKVPDDPSLDFLARRAVV